MKALKTLIKLHKTQINSLTKAINAIENRRTSLIQELEDLKNAVQLECQKYIGTDYAFMLDKYLTNAEENQKQLNQQINELEQQIDILRNQLKEQFSELKKFEIILQNRIQEERDIDRSNEIKVLDELTTIKFNSDKLK